MPTFPQLTNPAQSGAPEIVNEALETLEHQGVYGKNHATTTALTWGYYGGRWGGFSITSATLTLTNTATNYIVVALATGVASVSTSNTNWNNTTDYARVYQLTTAGGVVTATQDHRAGPGGVHGSLAGGALDSDLTVIAGLTATTDNFMQAKSSAWASRTPAQVAVDLQSTGLVADMVGFRNVPSNPQSTAYTAVAADSGKSLDHPASDANARTFTIPANGSVAYPDGTCISFSNMTSQVLTIAITTDTMYLAGTGATGSRSLAQYGTATARKLLSTTWIISGVGLT